MKIGIDISQAIYGTGVSDYTTDLVHTLLKTDPDNDYLLFGSSLRRGRDLTSLFPQAKTFPFPPMLLHLLWNRLHVVNIENLIGRVDVFHTSDWLEPPASAPKVTTIHDLSPFLFPEEMHSGFFRNISSVHAARMHWVVRESARIICVSHSTADQLQQLFKVPAARITVVPEALPSRFAVRPPPAAVSAVKREFNLGSYLLAIGTPQPRKNISRLARAYLTYADKLRLPDRLVIVGGHGWGLTDIPASDRIVFTGYLSDAKLAALLAGSAALVYPSLHEGFGLPILLGFHHRVPVVTSTISSMPEVAGQAAVLVDPLSVESIAHGLAKAVSDRSRLIAAGQQRLKAFSWEATAKKTLLVYRQVCS